MYSVENFKDTPIEIIPEGTSAARSHIELELNDEILKELTNTENEVKIGNSFKEILSVNKLERKITRGNLAYEIDRENKKLVIENKDQLEEIKILVLSGKEIKKIYKSSRAGIENENIVQLLVYGSEMKVGEIDIHPFFKNVLSTDEIVVRVAGSSSVVKRLSFIDFEASGFELSGDFKIKYNFIRGEISFEKTKNKTTDEDYIFEIHRNGVIVNHTVVRLYNDSTEITSPDLIIDMRTVGVNRLINVEIIYAKGKQDRDTRLVFDGEYSAQKDKDTYLQTNNTRSGVSTRYYDPNDTKVDTLELKRVSAKPYDNTFIMRFFRGQNSSVVVHRQRVRVINGIGYYSKDRIDFETKPKGSEAIGVNFIATTAEINNTSNVVIKDKNGAEVSTKTLNDLKNGIDLDKYGVNIKYDPSAHKIVYKKIKHREIDEEFSINFLKGTTNIETRSVDFKNGYGLTINTIPPIRFSESMTPGGTFPGSTQITFTNPDSIPVELKVDYSLRAPIMTKDGVAGTPTTTIPVNDILIAEKSQNKVFELSAKAQLPLTIEGGEYEGAIFVIVTVDP